MSFGDIQTGTDICVSVGGTRMAHWVSTFFLIWEQFL